MKFKMVVVGLLSLGLMGCERVPLGKPAIVKFYSGGQLVRIWTNVIEFRLSSSSSPRTQFTTLDGGNFTIIGEVVIEFK